MFARALDAWGRLFGLGQSSSQEDEERRAWGRVTCDVPTKARPASGPYDDWQSARVRNVSQGGIGLEMHSSFVPGILISIALPGEPDPGDTTEVLACVVRCVPLREGRFAVGCTFAAVLPDHDLARFGARQERAAEGDQRTWQRFPCGAQAFLVPVHGGRPANIKAALVLDISAGGIALETEANLHVGDLIQIDLVRDDEMLYSTLASVVRTGKAEMAGRLIIGANFIGELPEDRLAHLMR